MFSLQRNNKFCEMVRQFILTSPLCNILVLIFPPALNIYAIRICQYKNKIHNHFNLFFTILVFDLHFYE